MKTGNQYGCGEHGMVLMTSLMILAVLLAVGIGAGVMVRNDLQISGNLRRGAEAFYVAAAGLEWGKREVAQTKSFPPAPQNQSKNFAPGEFAVTFLSSKMVGPLSAQVVLRSTGTSHGAQQVVQAQLTKSHDLVDAALALRGNPTAVKLTADSIFISGVDHDVTTTNPVVGAKSRNAVSTADDSIGTLVLNALGDPPRQGVLDSGPDMPAVATSDYLSSGFISEFADQLCASAASIHSVPSTGVLVIENQVLGGQGAPQLHCVEGLSTPGDAATFAGTVTGVGILVVKNADLILSGALRWEGLILVTGNDVSLKTNGSSGTDLVGAVMVNETGIPGTDRAILDIQGTVRLLFSRQALSRIVPLVPTVAWNNLRQSLPSIVAQNYWRIVTP
jgi:Tfp pilus assembly protein PilX